MSFQALLCEHLGNVYGWFVWTQGEWEGGGGKDFSSHMHKFSLCHSEAVLCVIFLVEYS